LTLTADGQEDKDELMADGMDTNLENLRKRTGKAINIDGAESPAGSSHSHVAGDNIKKRL
jgi:hypothetical protein